MTPRELEDRIRDLCARASHADEAEIRNVLQELRAALQKHTQLLRKMAAEKLTGGTRQSGADLPSEDASQSEDGSS